MEGSEPQRGIKNVWIASRFFLPVLRIYSSFQHLRLWMLGANANVLPPSVLCMFRVACSRRCFFSLSLSSRSTFFAQQSQLENFWAVPARVLLLLLLFYGGFSPLYRRGLFSALCFFSSSRCSKAKQTGSITTAEDGPPEFNSVRKKRGRRLHRNFSFFLFSIPCLAAGPCHELAEENFYDDVQKYEGVSR